MATSATTARQSEPVNVESVLASVPMLTGLRPEEIRTLAGAVVVRNYAPDAYIMREDEDGDFFAIIVDGQVEVTTEKDGCIATLYNGDYAGEQALIKNTKRNASLHAITRTKCLVINQEAFQTTLGHNTRVRFAKRDAKRIAVLTEIEIDLKMDEDPDGEVAASEEEFVFQAFLQNFDVLTNSQTTRITKRLERFEVSASVDEGHLIRTGTVHPYVYLIMEGNVREVDEHGEVRREYGRGEMVNQIALYTNEPVDFSAVIVSANLVAYRLERKAYQYEITREARTELDDKMRFLRQVDIFKPLLQNELILVANALEKQSYEGGTTIFNEGDEGDKFYVIVEGRVSWSKSSTNESGVLRVGQFFGERALRTSEPRAATITVPTDITENDGSCVCFELSSAEFLELLGPVLDIIDDKIMSYVRANNDAARSSAIVLPADMAPLVTLADVTPLADLETIGVLGKGGFGLVTLVIDPKDGEPYALKAIRKDNVVKNKHQKHIVGERRVMEMLNSPFLVNLRATYKDTLRVYFLLDVCLGGELFTILRSYQYFDEHTARFYAACVIEAFDYMHSHDIIHRDLKPENLVLDRRGYAKLTDFGFAKHMPRMEGVTYTLCGTPDYLAPEIVTGKGHSKGVDWWTLGILIYEMLEGSPPFYAEQHIDTYRKIVKGKVHFPSYFSGAAKSLIRQLLHPKPTRRLGVIKGGAANIRQHSWFRGFHWRRFQEQKMRAPIVNRVADVRDLSNFRKAKIPVDDAEPVRPSEDFDEEF